MDAGNYVRFVAALIFVLGLIALATWLARRFGLGGAVKGVRRSDRRLKIIESITVDSKHRAVLIGRDDTEHLILVGATGEVVIETGITPPPAPIEAPPSEDTRRGRAGA